MSNSLFEHDFQVDLEPNENTYCTQDIQWQYINDNNQNNYSNGYINWTNLNLGTGSIDKMYSFSNAYITIPYSIVLYGDGTIFKFKAGDPANANAACLKSSACIVDWVSSKFDGCQLTRSSYNNHLMMNEKLKTYNTDKFKIYGDILGHAWDNGHSIDYIHPGIGELNNNILNITNINTFGLDPSNMTNPAHLQRCMKNNIDISRKNNSSLNTFLCKDDASAQASQPLRDNEHQSGIVFSDVNSLVIQGVACIPLSQLHPVFEKMPTMSSVQGFELRLQCNMARENTYSMTYPAISATSETLAYPTAVNVIQSIGKCCPVMISSPSGTGITGMRINAVQAVNGVLNVKCMIGWNVDINGVGFKGSTGPPCRIHLPTLSFTSDYLKDIANAPQYSLKYNDYYADTELNVKQGASVSRLFNTNLTRPRILYIFPFLSQSNITDAVTPANTRIYPSALTSPLSSSPITCTPCRLRNFNIQIGGQNIFSEPQQFNYSFYNSNAMSIISDINGNSPKSALFSGQISKSQWENGYNVYYVNLEKVSDIITDSTMKAFQLTYTVEGNNDFVLYDMYYIISYENELNLDRLTGKITGINQ